MKLRKLEIQGFKSFADKSTLVFEDGITGVVGPNGCGKCLSYNNSMYLRLNGKVGFLSIGEVVDSALVRSQQVTRWEEGVTTYENPEGAVVLSLNPKTLRLEERPVLAFVKRRAPGNLLRVVTASGREVTTTHYHPFFSLDDGALKTLRAEELQEGVCIAVPRSLPVAAGEVRLQHEDVLTSFASTDKVFAKSPSAQRSLQLNSVLNRGEIELEELESARGRSFTLPMSVNEDVAKLLGYLISEGHISASYAHFVNGDRAVVDEFCRVARSAFGVDPVVREYRAPNLDCYLNNSALCLYLERVFELTRGEVSAQKKVPPQLFVSPDLIVKAFLSSLFEGDGCLRDDRSQNKNALYWEYTTASKELAQGVITLLLRLGFFGILRERQKAATNTKDKIKRTYYSVYVYGAESARRLAQTLSFVGAKKRQIEALSQVEVASNPNQDLIPGLCPKVRRAIKATGLKVKPLRKQYPSLAAYNEQRCEVSRVGLNKVLPAFSGAAHPELEELQTLANADIYWDKIERIEKVYGEEWVYDLCVEETHNFVAENIFVHNSNVVDSIRWVMGEQRAKALRGASMEDVIFNGSESRRPVGLAEVKATFHIDTNELPKPFDALSEITIGRRMFRDGTSEYFINKTNCRMRDITDLFLGTGAGNRSYSVIEQGRVAALVTARPEERRAILEEAAGVTRYQRRREEALRKIEATKQNLARVNDIITELDKRLGTLKRQAEKAEKFKRLRDETRRLELHFAASREKELLAQKTQQEELATQYAASLDASYFKVKSAEERLSEAKVIAEEAARTAASLEQEAYGAENRLKLLLAELQHSEREKEELARRIKEAERELESATQALQLVETERVTLEADREVARKEAEQADLVVAQGEEALKQATTRSASLDSRLKELRDEEAAASRERAESLARLEGIVRQRADLSERLDALSNEREKEQETAEALLAQVQACEARLTKDRARQAELVKRRQDTELAVTNAKKAKQEAASNAEKAKGEVLTAQSRLQSLENIAKRFEGFSRGVRDVMNRHKDPKAAGLLGVVADLLDCPPHLQAAVAAALGDRIEAIVVDEPERALEEAEHLQKEKGRTLFLPLEAKAQINPSIRSLPVDAIADLASAVGASERQIASAIATLLDGAIAFSDLPSALEAWRQGWDKGPLVTLAGEVIEPEGLLRVGKGGTDGAAELLKRRREIRELESQLAMLREEYKVKESREHEATRNLESAEIEREKAKREEEELIFALKNTEADKKRAEGEAQKAQGRVRILAEERAKNISKLAELEGQNVELELTRDEAALREESARLALSKTLREAGEERSKIAKAQDLLSQARVKAAQEREKALAAAQALARQERTRQDLSSRAARATAQRDTAIERRTQIEESVQSQAQNAEKLKAHFDAVKNKLSGAKEAAEISKVQVSTSEGALSAARREESQLTQKRDQAQAKLREIEVARQMTRESLLARFRVTPEEILPDYKDLPAPTEQDHQRLQLLLREVDSMGEVNLTAIEEFQKEGERYRFLESQKLDLEGALNALDSAIQKLNKSSRELFQETFTAINQNFGKLFKRLFRGGTAELTLTESEDPLEAGVEIFAQPPGKRMQSVGLMSGGEKALTAVALTFGIFLLRPSPFCILDEVDAPLDEANVGRFADLIRDLQNATQFVMVTHNQRAMEIADTLYGVTMEEPGTSKIVSVKLKDSRNQPAAS